MIVPRGVWLATGTATRESYPCRCATVDDWTHRNGRCPCWGRTETAAMPAGCCGWGWLRVHRPDLLTFQWNGS